MVIFSGAATIYMLCNYWLHGSGVLLGFGIFQALITLLGIYAIIKNKMKEKDNLSKDSNDIEETK